MRAISRLLKGRKPTQLSKLAGALLNLSFVDGKAFDPRITFSRTTNATVTGSNGLVTYAPHNLLTYSEQFDNATWTKAGSTITANAVAAPDGTLTADALIETATTGNHQVYRLPGLGIATYTYSVYAKANGRTQFVVDQESGGAARFTLSGSGTAVALGANTVSIVALGNGWYRCSNTFTVTGAFGIYSNLYNGSTTSYTGNGTSGIYVWGAQLNIGELQDYNPTTVKNLLGYTEHFDNAAWTKSNAFVQTNLLLWSQDFDNAAWTKGNVAVVANTTGAPDGTQTADTITGDGTSTQHYVLQGMTTTGIRTISVYAKAGTHNFFQILTAGSANPVANFDLVNGTANMVGSGATASITSAGAGWYRCVLSSSDATATNVYFALVTSLASGRFEGNVVSGSVYFWGAQLVQGTSAGDYKATYATAAAVGYSDIYGQPFAQKLVENTATAGHQVTQLIVPTSGAVLTSTIYAKAGERRYFMLYANNPGSGQFFDLQTGTKLGTFGTAPTSSSITDVGNGWYRCSVTVTTTSTATTGVNLYMSNDGTGISYTGDGTSGIYIFGAQLSDSASVDPYVYNPVAAPTAQAYYGPRFDYDASTATYTELLGAELLGAATVGLVGSATAATYSTTTGVGTATRVDASNQSFVKWSSLSGGFYKVTVSCTSGVAISVRSGAQVGTPIATILSGSSATVFVPPTSGEISITSSSGTAGFTVASIKEYLGTTGTGTVPKGLLIEEQRTNRILYSEDFTGVSWAAAVSGTSTRVNDNNLLGFTRGIITATSALGGIRQQCSGLASGQVYALSFYIQSTATSVQIVFENGTATFGSAHNVTINPSNGTAGVLTGFTGISVQPFGPGYVYTLTTAAAAGQLLANIEWRITNINDSIRFGRPQFEAGSRATSYIPTVASQVTRAADSASMLGNNFAQWYNQTEGSVYVDATPASSGYSPFVQFDDGTANNRILAEGGVDAHEYVAVGGALQASIDLGATAANTSAKLAISYKANDFAGSLNGGAVGTDASGSIPTVTTARISANTSNSYSNTIKRIAYYPRRLSNAELQGITS